ncbi:uracil-DNA glycosylase [endosymbiont of unidentified scaly snail isolate Monju]|uniref:uracil-DNA glycosylase n=1 Tax=endosymbiont of unidentified scaly snail isolate Monju TaxID=1248727 RepID=UPI0005BCD8B0|nr:uracil-DNA glycosylase [endosymbiont of unidentified scaly snail isolate Monju]
MLDARRRACLRGMGIELWVQREAPARDPAPAPTKEMSPEATSVAPPETPLPVESPPAAPAAAPATPAMDQVPAVPAIDPASLDWDGLAAAVAGCRACGLCETRTQTVFGVGDRNARLMVIGEAPGAEEDRQGEPFVGRAGQLLDRMLEAIGLSRDQAYIANVLKCRPPGNRDPRAEEVVACRGWLDRQIALVQPEFILSVGGVAAKNLLETDEAVGRLRRRVHHYRETPLRVTYHPAYLLRRPEEKAKAWIDLQAVWRELQGDVS